MNSSTVDAAVEAERRWLETVYHHDREKELTPRVVLLSVLLGGLVVAFNLYMSLKTGLRFGGSIIAVLLAYAVARAARQHLSPLENNLTQTAASAAGSIGSIVNVIPALFLLAADGILPTTPTLLDVMLWVLASSFLGVFFAVPLRRQAIVVDRLTFPTGMAAAETIRALHTKGANAVGKVRALGLAGLIAGAITWFRDGVGAFIPGVVKLPASIKTLFGVPAASLNIGVAISPMMLGVGFLIGPRIATSIFVTGLVGWGIVAPWLVDSGVVEVIAETMTPELVLDTCRETLALAVPTPEQMAFARSSCKQMWRFHNGSYYGLAVRWLLWPGLGLMLAGGLVSMAIRWRLVVESFRGLFSHTGGERPLAHLEMPRHQWLIGMAIGSVAIMALLQLRFGVAWYLGLLAIGLSFVLAVITVRCTGETDLNPSGPMGSVTQITFGSVQTQLGITTGAANIITGNLMTGGIAASAASEAADMMQDLKTGWVLGATPRRQVYMQVLGVTVGALLAAPIFWLFIQNDPIGSAKWPAPAAATWSALATMMTRGTAAMPPGALAGLCVGAAIGTLLATVETLRPNVARRFLPSAVGMGVALIVPLLYSTGIFLGAMLLVALRRFKPDWTVTHALAIGAGVIAGEALFGILAALVGLVVP